MRTIPIKESLTIEFKSDKKKYSDADLVDEIVGMTNTKGGTLYLGVEDNGEVTGVHPKHKDAIGVTALIANSTVPSVSVRAEVITEEEKDVLKIEIPVCITKISTFLILCDLAVCLATLYVSFSLVFALMRYLQGKVFLIRFYSPTTLSSSRAEFRLPSRLACA